MIEEMALEQLLCFPCDLLEQLAVSRWPPVTQKERPNKALPLPSVDAAAVRLSLQGDSNYHHWNSNKYNTTPSPKKIKKK
eukprot:gene12428-8523_t